MRVEIVSTAESEWELQKEVNQEIEKLESRGYIIVNVSLSNHYTDSYYKTPYRYAALILYKGRE